MISYSDDCHVIFLESKRLGVLEGTMSHMTAAVSKRERKAELNRIARVLRDLHVIDEGIAVLGAAYGCDSTGELGLFLVTRIQTRVQGDLPK